MDVIYPLYQQFVGEEHTAIHITDIKITLMFLPLAEEEGMKS